MSEVKLQLQLAGPMCATYLLQVMVDMITLIMVGHIGEVQLAAAGEFSPCLTIANPCCRARRRSSAEITHSKST